MRHSRRAASALDRCALRCSSDEQLRCAPFVPPCQPGASCLSVLARVHPRTPGARGQSPCGIRGALHPRWTAALCVAPRTSSSAARPSSRLASPALRASRCSPGFIHGLREPVDKAHAAFEARCIRAGPLRSALLLGRAAPLRALRPALPARRFVPLGARPGSSTDSGSPRTKPVRHSRRAASALDRCALRCSSDEQLRCAPFVPPCQPGASCLSVLARVHPRTPTPLPPLRRGTPHWLNGPRCGAAGTPRPPGTACRRGSCAAGTPG